MTTSTKAPTWFNVVAILAIIWNIFGVLAYLGQAFMPPEVLEAMPIEQQEAYANRPAWATAAFATAVFAGFLGCVSLALKKNIAKALLLVSLVAVIINDIYMFFFIDAIAIYGMTALFMQVFVLVIAIYLVMLFNKAKANSWIS